MKKTWRIMAALALLLAGCNNFFHELVPPDENRILSFAVPGQRGEASISENGLMAMVEQGTDITALIPAVTLSPRAALLPLTMDYVSAAFPSADLFRTAVDLHAADDLAAYVIGLIKANPGFNVPALDRPIDFTGPAEFLVIGGLGSIRRYTARVSADTGAAQILSFGFSKYDNPFLMFDALGFVDEAAKTIGMLAVFPAELEQECSLVPGFELLGEALEADGSLLRSGLDPLAFDLPLNSPPPAAPQQKALTVRRAGYPSSEYTLQLMSAEDPDTIRSIIDFRFAKADNPGIVATAVASIINNGDRGLIRVQVLYRGAKPTTLKARHISPGTVTVGGAPQIPGVTANDFSSPLEYRVVSRNGLYSRVYRVEAEFIDASEPAPRLLSFRFPADLNGELSQTAVGEINEGAGLVMVDVRHTGAAAPRSLIPEFSATGLVKVSGLTQTSGAGGRDFARQVKCTVVSPDDPSLYRDYWVQTVFVPDHSGAASVTAFSFHPDENPQLADEARGRIDQIAGTIDLYLPYGANIGSVPLVPRFSAHGKVTVEGALQASGAGARLFDQPALYEVESANGLNRKTYTVRVQELNTRLYVDRDAAGLNNGASWADAFINLRAACEAAALFPDHVPREIWIAGGTYTPSQTGDPAAFFPLTPNTSYIGGFAGWEAGKGQRSPAANPVIISGDLGGARSRHLFYGASIPVGELVFEDLTFTKAKTLTGTGQDHSGAALSVSASGGTVRIQGCAFTDLEAGYYGGAVYVIGAGLDLSESGFDSCRVPTSSGKHGGAVYVALPNQAGAAVNVEDVTFNASSAGNGGAVSVSANGGTVRIQGCVFTDLEADDSGGAVYVNGAGLDLSQSRFDSCRVPTTYGKVGGAVYAELPNQAGAAVYVEDVTFNATSAYLGGAVRIQDSYENNNAVNFSHISLENVFAASSGGLYVNGRKNAVTMSHITINKTTTVTANTRSGIRVVSSNGGTVELSNMELYNAGIYSGVGIGMTKLENITVINSSTFQNDNITISGGADISNVTVEGTWPASSYGAVYIEIEGRDVVNISKPSGNPTGLTIRNINGRGLFIYNRSTQPTTVSDLAISNTTASGAGGGAHIRANGALSIGNTNINGTQATGTGGGIYIQNSSTQATTISGLTISNTTALGTGGGMDIQTWGALSITNTDINNTSSGGGGGGIAIVSFLPNMTYISGLTISNTKAIGIIHTWGGGAYIRILDGGGLSINGMTITGTESGYVGGGLGIHIQNSSNSFSLANITITGASAPSGSGAIMASTTGFSVTNTTVNGTPRDGSYGPGNHYWN